MIKFNGSPEDRNLLITTLENVIAYYRAQLNFKDKFGHYVEGETNSKEEVKAEVDKLNKILIGANYKLDLNDHKTLVSELADIESILQQLKGTEGNN